ncbi:S1 family peptidase [Kineosporia babensis]|uniref:Trypsin-like serine protease n=1 Tax=Kineosporia babensis TaxID=499548 RepID=A0A9X1NK85_9ACTN|nr:trypsin-like serine protease [Kineosporia babensis]MCD5315124.1 trypsin-like serine protease [Kineosporia babensis]
MQQDGSGQERAGLKQDRGSSRSGGGERCRQGSGAPKKLGGRVRGRGASVAVSLMAVGLMAGAGLLVAPPSAQASVGVIDGKKSVYGPWAVRMLVDGKPHCTGTALTDQWVISASHCFFDRPDKPVADRRITFRAGNLNQREGQKVRVIRGSRVASPNGADVMLIKVQKMKDVKPAKLSRAAVRPGQAVRVFGWGATCEDDEHKCQANQLRQADLKVLSAKKKGCEYYAAPGGKDFCAVKVRGVPAGGDSGAPVMTIAPKGKERMVGVFWGSDREKMVGAAAITKQLKWIRSVTG